MEYVYMCNVKILCCSEDFIDQISQKVKIWNHSLCNCKCLNYHSHKYLINHYHIHLFNSLVLHTQLKKSRGIFFILFTANQQ